MVLGIYHTLSEAELLTMRTDALAALAAARAGKRYSGVGGHGKSYTKDNLTYDQLVQELQEINASLRKKDPAKYGRRVTCLVPDFSRANT